jgi:predicted house-cleaning NTP pyrophosphatase (Maf/HAM1 superfamily)
MTRLVLASASPRRAELMRQIELPFVVLPSSFAEPSPAGWAPEDFVVDLALHKARSVQRLLSARGEAEEALWRKAPGLYWVSSSGGRGHRA